METKKTLRQKGRANVPVEKSLYRQFKMICLEKDLFVFREMERLLTEYIEQNKKNGKTTIRRRITHESIAVNE